MEPAQEGSFFITNHRSEFDHLMDPGTLMHSAADYYRDRFEGIKALRDADDGTGHKGQEFRCVASFVNVPMFMAMKLQDPELLTDKRKFYAFLDRHPEYVTYQRRNGGRMTAKDELKLPLSALGLDYPGGPEAIEDFEPVPLADPVEPEPVVEAAPEAV